LDQQDKLLGATSVDSLKDVPELKRQMVLVDVITELV
jgi:hypothetical protein